jgi:hypothetical protein
MNHTTISDTPSHTYSCAVGTIISVASLSPRAGR